MIPQNNYLRSFTRAAISPVCLNSLLRHLYIIHNNAWAKLICVNLAFAHLIAGCSPKTKLDEIVITSSSYESVCLALKLSWNRRYSWSIFLAFTLSFHEYVHSNQLIIAFSPSFLKGEAFSLHFFIGTLIFSLLCHLCSTLVCVTLLFLSSISCDHCSGYTQSSFSSLSLSLIM